jgi:hypothetical protein
VKAAEIRQDSHRDIGRHERVNARDVDAETVIPPMHMRAGVFVFEKVPSHRRGKT